MLRLAADEDFNQAIIRGLRRRIPGADVVTVQEAGLAGRSDSEVLAWAAGEGRVVVTHDARTMGRHAFDRSSAGEPMAGVLIVSKSRGIGPAIELLTLAIEVTEPGEWLGVVEYF